MIIAQNVNDLTLVDSHIVARCLLFFNFSTIFLILILYVSGRGRPDYRDYRGPGSIVRDRFSPDRYGPPKRMRTDWGDDRLRYGDSFAAYGVGGWGGVHHEYGMHGGHGGGSGYANALRDVR